jgi:hypothetical protein
METTSDFAQKIQRRRIRIQTCSVAKGNAEGHPKRLLRLIKRYTEAVVGGRMEGSRHHTSMSHCFLGVRVRLTMCAESGMGALRSPRAGATYLAVQVSHFGRLLDRLLTSQAPYELPTSRAIVNSDQRRPSFSANIAPAHSSFFQRCPFCSTAIRRARGPRIARSLTIDCTEARIAHNLDFGTIARVRCVRAGSPYFWRRS